MTREEKMKIVINNYFKTECSVNTSIREAFEKGFRIGASKVQKKHGKWIEYEQEFMLEEPFKTVQKTVRECSVCTAKIAGMVGIMNFCPNCGAEMEIDEQPTIQPVATDTNVGTKLSTNLAEVGTDCISRRAAIEALKNRWKKTRNYEGNGDDIAEECELYLKQVPSAQQKQRYTEEELRVFRNGISLSLLSKRSSQHWRYDEDTATEIKFLERLYVKVSADMRGEQDGRFNQQTGGD